MKDADSWTVVAALTLALLIIATLALLIIAIMSLLSWS
jgi:hypothetical protein